jgi:hypothetical protein
MQSWRTIATGKPIIAMAGELGVLSASDAPQIAEYGRVIAGNQAEAHFFSDSAQTDPAILDAIARL